MVFTSCRAFLSRPRFCVTLGRSAVAAGLLLGALRAAHAQDASAPAPLAQNTSLKQLMTPEEFKAAGLKKLNGDELAHLETLSPGLPRANRAAGRQGDPGKD